MKKEEIKRIVKEKYSRIAMQSDLLMNNEVQGCCDTTGCCSEVDYTVFSESYEKLEGYNADADLGLGCGIPTEFAGLKEGQHVLDLGSGAGNDCFVARSVVGDPGKVVGIDFSEEMIRKAIKNTRKLGYKNVEFLQGDIEQMPLEDNMFDVVLSNCVLNLVPDKNAAFAEIMRVLKHGGHFCVSDVVIKGELPDKLKNDAEMYAGCVSGAMQMDDYIDVIKNTGFENIIIHKERSIEIPENILRLYFDDNEMQRYTENGIGIFSITVSAEKRR